MSAVTAPRGRVGYAAVFGLATFAALGWLALGGVAALLRYWPGLLDPAAATGGFQSCSSPRQRRRSRRPSWPSTTC